MVVALGGGVVGDLAGFCASTFMRGIDFVQIPTTLLSAIDSSIGGKTGINLENGKNLLGCFWQPKLVYFDIATLNTLSDKEWKNGIGEGIKYAIFEGKEIFGLLQDDINVNLEKFISLCQKSKINIVQKDEYESNLRKYLNLGHTIGHAIEKLSNFKISHGIAVANGIYIMCKSALKNNQISQQDFDKIEELLLKFDLLIDLNFSINEYVDCIKQDKKLTAQGDISLIKIYGIGKCKIETMTLEEFKEYIA